MRGLACRKKKPAFKCDMLCFLGRGCNSNEGFLSLSLSTTERRENTKLTMEGRGEDPWSGNSTHMP